MNIQTPTFEVTTPTAVNDTLDGLAVLSRVQARQTLADVACINGGLSSFDEASVGTFQKAILKDLLILKAQEALEELLSKGQLPFRLTACDLKKPIGHEYTVAFHDSRIHSITFAIRTGASFKDAVRVAVLQRLSRVESWRHSELVRRN